ncbi:MAG TPA: MetQ/NlpA family lipoprotein [Sphingobacterium sp.]|nr:MetQ/NlpA family lipoprotein [Sphingobacterium sp.]
MNLNVVKSLLICLISGFFLSCSSSGRNSDTLLVGVQAGPEYKLAEVAKKVAKEKFDIDVELISFTDYVMPNEALNQKDIDMNVFQTRPYLEEQAHNRGYDFEVVGNTFVYPMAGYSNKIKDVSELKEGDTIVIPNDPSNLGRALLLLQEIGLIVLDENVGLLPTRQHIKENRLNLRIMELEAPQLPRTLDDRQVTVAIINNNFAANNGLIASRDGIFSEGKNSPYVNIIVSRKDNKDDEKVQKFAKAYQSEEVEAVADQEFKGSAVKGW